MTSSVSHPSSVSPPRVVLQLHGQRGPVVQRPTVVDPAAVARGAGVAVRRRHSPPRIAGFLTRVDPAAHPFYVAAQFHPEFKSRVMCPSPLFLGLLQASVGKPPGVMADGPQSPRKRSVSGAR